jgi:hypothetical protein
MPRSALTPQEFVNKWHKAELKERSAAQEHFIDLCRMLNHPTPAEADPKGKRFTSEGHATEGGRCQEKQNQVQKACGMP